MNSDDHLPFRLAREIAPGPLRPNRLRWMKSAYYAAPFAFPVVILIEGAAGYFLYFFAGQEWMSRNAATLTALFMGSIICLVAMMIVAIWKFPKTIDRELRHGIQTAKLSALIPLQPILLLRSFIDDELKSKGEGLGRVVRNRIEERIVQAAEGVAPVVALGRPGEDLPYVGAHRFYVVDEDWQAAVIFLLPRCRYVIIVYNPGTNVQWEVRQAFEKTPLERLIVILPMPERGFRFLNRLSRTGRENQQRLEHASEIFRSYTGHPLPDLSKRTEIVVFKNGEPVFLERRRSTSFKILAWVYGISIAFVLFAMLGTVIGVMLLRGTGFLAALTSSDGLGMSAVSVVVISCTLASVFEYSRFGSYTEMLKAYFGRS
jgi:hypothetical protein